MAKENENTLDPKIVECLNGLDWDSLKAKTGITREAVEKNPEIARQLAFGSVTDLIAGHAEGVSGFYALRAIPSSEEGKLGCIKVYTIESEKKSLMSLKGETFSDLRRKNSLAMYQRLCGSVSNAHSKSLKK